MRWLELRAKPLFRAIIIFGGGIRGFPRCGMRNSCLLHLFFAIGCLYDDHKRPLEILPLQTWSARGVVLSTAVRGRVCKWVEKWGAEGICV